MSDIIEEIEKAHKILGSLCKEARPPRMSIPAEPTDEDLAGGVMKGKVSLSRNISSKLYSEVHAALSDWFWNRDFEYPDEIVKRLYEIYARQFRLNEGSAQIPNENDKGHSQCP